MIVIKTMKNADIRRIAEIDRSEHITRAYQYRDGALEMQVVDWQVPSWFPEGDLEHSLRSKLEAWTPLLEEHDGTLLGAFDGDRMAGFAIYRPRLEGDMAQLAVLHVSHDYRRQGIGAALTEQVVRLAVADGARRLYVSATPSRSTVEFYRARGFELADRVHPDLYEQEPMDIHLIRDL
ncbi:MAG: GNAT family N-acetyltransferase [Anaerolineae bacterium]|jgi:GNAT superfamily N-acetyltransferase